MKPYGTTSEFQRERDRDLLNTFRMLIEREEHISMPEIFRQIVNMPSARFWVTEERAAIVLSAMFKGDRLTNMTTNKKEMFQEIFRRALIIRERNPSLPIIEIAWRVIHQPAPKFYLTPRSARTIIYAAKQRCLKETKKRLRHCF